MNWVSFTNSILKYIFSYDIRKESEINSSIYNLNKQIHMNLINLWLYDTHKPYIIYDF